MPAIFKITTLMDDHVYNKQELVGLKSYLFIQYGKDIAILKLLILDLNVINTKKPHHY